MRGGTLGYEMRGGIQENYKEVRLNDTVSRTVIRNMELKNQEEWHEEDEEDLPDLVSDEEEEDEEKRILKVLCQMRWMKKTHQIYS